MKRIKMMCFLLALLGLLSACSAHSVDAEEQSAPTWQSRYDLGVRYLSDGRYEEAILAFTAAIEIDPKRPLAYVGRGDAYAAQAGAERAGQRTDGCIPQRCGGLRIGNAVGERDGRAVPPRGGCVLRCAGL